METKMRYICLQRSPLMPLSEGPFFIALLHLSIISPQCSTRLVSLPPLALPIHPLKVEGFLFSNNLSPRVNDFLLVCLGTTLGDSNVTTILRQPASAPDAYQLSQLVFTYRATAAYSNFTRITAVEILLVHCHDWADACIAMLFSIAYSIVGIVGGCPYNPSTRVCVYHR